MNKRKKKIPVTNDYLDMLTRRIDDCDRVLRHLSDCDAFRVIKKDLSEQEKIINDNWHTVTDEKKLQELRVTKFAISHLVNLEEKYKEDKENAEKELRKLRNTDKEILMDYDTETRMEDDDA